jgi:glutamate 5-kinase
MATGRPVVVKVGSTSLTTADGQVDSGVVARLAGEVAVLTATGRAVVVVSSGAVTAGLGVLGVERPSDVRQLQAVSAVGQIELMREWGGAFARHGLVIGQVLLTPYSFRHRPQYLQARSTLERLSSMGVVPVVNENDAVADDEIRFGDNDRLAGLVAHLVDAEVLVLLTDTPGVLTADPRRFADVSLIAEIVEVDRELQQMGGRASTQGSGGMASKLASARIAAWTGVRTVIADARREGVVADAVDGVADVGTIVHPHDRRLPARKLWIAFATGSQGRVTVDAGATRALVERNRSLLPAGVTGVEGSFDAGDAVEIVDPAGAVFAKGLVRVSAAELRQVAGRRTPDLPRSMSVETVHRDDLVVLPAGS